MGNSPPSSYPTAFSTTKRDLLFTIVDRASVRDVALLLSMPAVLLLVYAAPESMKLALSLDSTDPTVLTAFTNHFVHLSWTHLVFNLVGFTFLASLNYSLAVTSGKREQFLVMFLIYVFVFPFVFSAFTLMLGWSGISVGFSGIVMGFIGYLPITLTHFLGARFRFPLTTHQSVWFFLGGVSLAAFVALPPIYGVTIATITFFAIVIFLWRAVHNLDDLDRGRVRTFVGTTGNVELAMIGCTTFILYQFIAFAPDVVTSDGILNVYTHGLGMCLGFLVAYVGTVSGWLDID